MGQICYACKQPLPKLTKEEVQVIYQMRCNHSEIAKEAGVSRQTIWMIKHKKLHAAWTDGLDVDSIDADEV